VRQLLKAAAMTEIRHFTTDLDLSHGEQAQVLQLALAMKSRPGDYTQSLRGKILGMIFTKSSTRTRVSFEAGIIQLGGQAIFLSTQATQLGRGEPISDTGQVLSRYLDLLMIRTFSHDDVQGLAQASRVPVINGLDDLYHPCQVLADLMTIREYRGVIGGQKLAYVGDGNNMAHSLALGGALAGLNIVLITPAGYAPDADIISRAQALASEQGGRVEISDTMAAAEGADIVYTDVWASMGQEEEARQRRADFSSYQVNRNVMQGAQPDAIFLHCLPAHRGEEVSADVIDGECSRVFDQAENRLHAQKALMHFLTAPSRSQA
jgi:ornithine carbamoyltransferase